MRFVSCDSTSKEMLVGDRFNHFHFFSLKHNTESRAICRYISETYADRGNRCLGSDLLDRVSIEQWLKSEEQSFDPPSRALVLHLAFPPSTKSYNILEESERLAKVLFELFHIPITLDFQALVSFFFVPRINAK
jgi:glutathione S-transferase